MATPYKIECGMSWNFQTYHTIIVDFSVCRGIHTLRFTLRHLFGFAFNEAFGKGFGNLSV